MSKYSKAAVHRAAAAVAVSADLKLARCLAWRRRPVTLIKVIIHPRTRYSSQIITLSINNHSTATGGNMTNRSSSITTTTFTTMSTTRLRRTTPKPPTALFHQAKASPRTNIYRCRGKNFNSSNSNGRAHLARALLADLRGGLPKAMKMILKTTMKKTTIS